ncbi:MAG TPA: hypothetical protein VGF59_24775 [Bryobacteraceae bacterium]
MPDLYGSRSRVRHATLQLWGLNDGYGLSAHQCVAIVDALPGLLLDGSGTANFRPGGLLGFAGEHGEFGGLSTRRSVPALSHPEVQNRFPLWCDTVAHGGWLLWI